MEVNRLNAEVELTRGKEVEFELRIKAQEELLKVNLLAQHDKALHQLKQKHEA